jgi:thiol-disulfide isomerase/thioredoxin/uncharacterized membrane protein YphA (DoxX/SURF4 family)
VDIALLAIRLVLAAVFLTAAAGKLLDRPGSRAALEQFGLPARLAAPGALALPVLELAVAASLVGTPTARAGAVGAAVLLLAFVAAIARAMHQGEAPDCHCFGQLHSEPAGRSTLVRNAALGVAAVAVAGGGAGRSLAALDAQELALLLTSLAAAISVPAAAILWRENRDLRARNARRRSLRGSRGLPKGAPAPDLGLTDVHGQPVTLESLLALGKPVAFVSVAPDCGPCKALMPDLARWESAISDVTVRGVSSGELDAGRALAQEHGLESLLVAEPGAVRRDLRVGPTPAAVLIDSDGTIAAAPAVGAPAIEALIRVALDPEPVLRVVQA